MKKTAKKVHARHHSHKHASHTTKKSWIVRYRWTVIGIMSLAVLVLGTLSFLSPTHTSVLGIISGDGTQPTHAPQKSCNLFTSNSAYPVTPTSRCGTSKDQATLTCPYVPNNHVVLVFTSSVPYCTHQLCTDAGPMLGECGYKDNMDSRQLNPSKDKISLSLTTPITNGRQDSRTVICDNYGNYNVNLTWTTSYQLFDTSSHSFEVVTSPKNGSFAYQAFGDAPYSHYSGSVSFATKSLKTGQKIAINVVDKGYKNVSCYTVTIKGKKQQVCGVMAPTGPTVKSNQKTITYPGCPKS